jgi:hypothetical protein
VPRLFTICANKRSLRLALLSKAKFRLPSAVFKQLPTIPLTILRVTMKKSFFLAILLSSTLVHADDPKNEWQNTTLTDATIKKIQESKYQYKKCVAEEMQKPGYQQLDIRKGAEQIVKQCEPVLARMRDVYIAEKVPEVIADRHLKQMRMQTTRSAIQAMMFAEAARKSGQK